MKRITLDLSEELYIDLLFLAKIEYHGASVSYVMREALRELALASSQLQEAKTVGEIRLDVRK